MMLATLGTLGTLTMLHGKPVADPFTGTLFGVGTAFLCIAFAWDGLVRRRMFLPAFPVGAALGDQAIFIRRLGAIVVGLVASLVALFCLLFALGFYGLALQQQCQHQGALVCAGRLAGSAALPSWVWFVMCAGWFVVVWLRMGDSRKHVLVYGVWYHEEQVARQITQQLRERGVPTLPQARLYALEGAVVQLMRQRGWLVYGDAWLDGGSQRKAREVPLETMVQDPALQDEGASERVAIELLLTYFRGQAQHAQQLSPLWRWWIGTAQRGKLGVYGRRAL